MTNNWNPPAWLEKKARKRDKKCVYCGIKLKEYYPGKGNNKSTLEHIENRPNVKEWNIAFCCNSCNSSKGTRKLSDWLESDYCKKKNIHQKNVAEIIKKYIKRNVSEKV